MVKRIISLSKLTHGMKRYNVFAALLFLGIVVGVLFSNLFQQSYYASWEKWSGQFTNALATMPINGGELFIYIVVEKLKIYLLLWVLATTVVGNPYIYTYCTYKGFTMGFWFCLLMQERGMRAFLVFGSYHFPQCLVYIPVFFLTFAACKDLNRQWGNEGQVGTWARIKGLRSYLVMFAALLALLLFGCMLEAYVNPGILKGTLVK